MDEQILELYHRFVGRGFDRQLRFGEFIARKAPGEDWGFDTETAVLTFGSKLRFEAPIVGSHAEHNDSWMWAWANRTVKMSVTNRALGDTIRALANRAMVPALARSAFPIEPLVGPELTEHAVHVFGVVLLGELEYDAYFLAPYDRGRALLLIRDNRLLFTEKQPLARVLTVFPQVIAAFPVPDHRAAFVNYAHAYGLHIAEEPGIMKVTGTGPGVLTAKFDDRNRLVKLEAEGVTIPKPPPAPPVKKKAAAKNNPVTTPAARVKAKPKPAAKKKPAPAAKSKPKPGKKR